METGRKFDMMLKLLFEKKLSLLILINISRLWQWVFTYAKLTSRSTIHISINHEIQYYFLFSGFFTELLIKSKLKFHRLFRKTYGIIYERNSDVFIDFFRDLESYYDHGNVRSISFFFSARIHTFS